ncbi:MAG: hypothetical protein ACE5MH_04710 [Terriglobia bacterium]
MKKPDGTLVNGTIEFNLSQQARTITPPQMFVPVKTTCAVTNGAIAAGCTVQGNDTLDPAGTFYRVRVVDNNNIEVLPPTNYTISGALVDLGSLPITAQATLQPPTGSVTGDMNVTGNLTVGGSATFGADPQVFSHLRFSGLTADPATVTSGSTWYRSDLDSQRLRVGKIELWDGLQFVDLKATASNTLETTAALTVTNTAGVRTKRLNFTRWVDPDLWTQAGVTAKIDAAINDCGGLPCLVALPSNLSAGEPTSVPGNVSLLDLRNAGEVRFGGAWVPRTTGNALGSSSLRWDAFLNDASAVVLNNVVYADTQSGADAGAQIQAAHDSADCPATGCKVDASGFQGALATITTNIVLSKTGIHLLLGAATFTFDTDASGLEPIRVTADNVTIECSAGTVLTVANSLTTTNAGRIINPEGVANFKLLNCDFDGNLANQTANSQRHTVYVEDDGANSSTNHLYEGNTFRNADGDGVYLTGSISPSLPPQHIRVVHNYFSGSGRNGVTVDSGEFVTVGENQFDSIMAACVDVEPNNDGDIARDIVITNNICNAARFDVSGRTAVDGAAFRRVVLKGNVSINSPGDAFNIIAMPETTVANNKAYSPISSCFIIRSAGNSVTDNDCYDPGTNAFSFSASGVHTPDSNRAIGNYVDQGGSATVYMFSSADNNIAVSNVVEDANGQHAMELAVASNRNVAMANRFSCVTCGTGDGINASGTGTDNIIAVNLLQGFTTGVDNTAVNTDVWGNSLGGAADFIAEVPTMQVRSTTPILRITPNASQVATIQFGSVGAESGSTHSYDNNTGDHTFDTPGATNPFIIRNAGTIDIIGQLASSLATGTAPLSITSTTVVPNLNVDQLDSADWAAPAAIGSGTPAAGTFTTMTVNTGVGNNGGGFKHARTSTGSVAAGSSAAVSVTWTTAFADASYTPVCSVQEATAGTASLRVHHIESILAANITVRVVNDDGAAAKTGTLLCQAVHD